MSELMLRTRLSNGQTIAQPISDFSEVAALSVEAGATYTIIDANTQETPVGLVFERREQDLEIELEGETLVVLDDFYVADNAATFSSNGSFAPSADFALTSADVPAVSAAGSLEAVDAASDVSASFIPAAATLNPMTWGWAGVAGGTVAAAGIGTGVGLAVADDDSDDGVPTAVVVFDLAADGDSSDHSDQTFRADTTYTIYIRVPSDSDSSLVALDPAERWSGAGNLGEDDVIILVGDDGPVQDAYGSPVATMNTETGWIWWSGTDNAASLSDSGAVYRYGTTLTTDTYTTTTFTPSTFSVPITFTYTTTTVTPTSSSTITNFFTSTTYTPSVVSVPVTNTYTSTYTTTTTQTAHLWSETGWSTSANPNQDNSFSQAYLTTMPAGIMTTQGLA